jgi:hypothetical protein
MRDLSEIVSKWKLIEIIFGHSDYLVRVETVMVKVGRVQHKPFCVVCYQVVALESLTLG